MAAVTSTVAVMENSASTVKAYLDANANVGDRICVTSIGSSIMVIIYNTT